MCGFVHRVMRGWLSDDVRVQDVPTATCPRHAESVARPYLLVPIFGSWAIMSVAVGAVFLRRAPAVSLALFGSLLGAVAGFLVGNADGPAEVPAYTAVGASVGLFSNGVMGMLTTVARPPSRPLRRATLLVLIAAPLTAGVLTLLVRLACPLYVSGRGSGFCNYQGIDLLGGWVSGVIVAFLFDAVFVAGLLLLSARQARRSESAMTTSNGV
jgi:hypothetical protein